MLVPLYSFLRGDSLGMVVLVQDRHTIAQLAMAVMRSGCMRVTPAERAAVYFRGQRLDDKITVAQAGLEALDRIDVVPEELDGRGP